MPHYNLGVTLLAVLGLLMCSPALAEAELDLNVNDDAFRLSGGADFGRRGRWDAGVLSHQDRGEMVHLGAHLVDEAASETPLTAGLGGRVVWLSPDGDVDDEFAVAIGGFVRYEFPNANRLSVGANLYYAPDVLGFGDLDEFVELGARVSYNVLRDADVYLGARYIRIDVDPGGEFTLDNGLIVGVQFRF
ncbi:MAG: YfaZ family outer membrane protein [Pseudomonadota bacterium]